MWAIALGAETPRDAIDDALRAAGLVLVDLRAAAGGQPRQIVAMTPLRDGVVTFVQDPALCYALADGERARELCSVIASYLSGPAWSAVAPALRAHVEAMASLFEREGAA